MSDRYDFAVRGLIGTAILACAITAVVVPTDGVSPQARARWVQLANNEADPTAQVSANDDPAAQHVAAHTFAIDTVTAGGVERRFTGAAVNVPSGTAVAIHGWAIAPGLKRSATRLVYRVDGGRWAEATYHLQRPDVAAALAMPEAADSGWQVDIVPTALRRGPNAIGLATVWRNGMQKRLSTRVIVTITGSEKPRP